MGPTKTEKPNITKTLPRLSANANFAGRIGMSGAVRKATKKQTAAPNKHAPKPNNLSHLERAKYASSSFDLSLVLRGI